MAGRKTVVAAVVMVGVLVGAAVLGTLFQRPTVESVDNDWGTVTERRTEVETQIRVNNPTVLQFGENVADVTYTVSLNGVEMAHGVKRAVHLSQGRNVVNLSTWLDNDEIPEWWASHVNRNGTTTVRVDSNVTVERVGVRLPATSMTRTRMVETNLLEPLRTNQTRTFNAFGHRLLVVNGTDAHWGHATTARTPLNASATVTNPTSVPIPVTNVSYTIRMNGIVVGSGEAARRTVIPPGATRTIEASAVIDNSKLDEWWVTHRRNNGTSQLTVDFYATVPTGEGTRRVHLDFLSYRHTFETNILGPDGPAVNGSTGQRRSSAVTVTPAARRFEPDVALDSPRTPVDAARPA